MCSGFVRTVIYIVIECYRYVEMFSSKCAAKVAFFGRFVI